MHGLALATEDELSESVGKRLITEYINTDNITCLRKQGSGYLRSNLHRWCELAQRQPVVLLTDLDRLTCSSQLLNDWFCHLNRPQNLVFRVAVREIESWLLADHDAMYQLIGSNKRLPAKPDTLSDPKLFLLELAKKAPRYIRSDLIKEKGAAACQGIGYNARLSDFVANSWNPELASQRSPSLHKACLRLHELGQRLHTNSA